MNIQNLLLLLYPRAWRVRYEEEFLEMLSSRPFSLAEGVDVIRGALDAHLHPYLGTVALPLSEKMRQMISAMRRSLIAIFCAYSGFILAGMVFQKMTENGTFQQPGQAGSLVELAFQLVVFGAIVALLVLMAGAIPIVGTMIRFAIVRKRYGILLELVAPFLACAAFFLLIRCVQALYHPGLHSGWQPILSRGVFFGSLLAVAVISVGTVCHAVARSEVSERTLHFALLPAILLTFSMALVLAAIIIWGLGLYAGAPQLFVSNNGLMGTSTIGTWFGIVIAMGIATGWATFSLLCGLSAQSTLYSLAA